MKKIIMAAVAAIVLAGCGVGSYSVSSGKADQCELSFTSLNETPITVYVDGKTHDISTVKTKIWKKDRKIKETALNTLILAPGAHDVKVVMNGQEVYSKKLFISTSEHKIVEL